jgi:hypothetical protein
VERLWRWTGNLNGVSTISLEWLQCTRRSFRRPHRKKKKKKNVRHIQHCPAKSLSSSTSGAVLGRHLKLVTRQSLNLTSIFSTPLAYYIWQIPKLFQGCNSKRRFVWTDIEKKVYIFLVGRSSLQIFLSDQNSKKRESVINPCFPVTVVAYLILSFRILFREINISILEKQN